MKRIFILIISIIMCLNVFSQVKTLTSNKFFSEIYDSENEVFINQYGIIIDLYATWCGPCRVMSPTFDDVAREYSSYFDFYRVDIDDNGDLAEFFEARSIPMIIYIPAKTNNSGYYSSVGVISKKELIDRINVTTQPLFLGLCY